MLNNILSAVNDWMYTYLLLFLLVGTGIYFTIRTRFVQLRLLKESFHVLKEKQEKKTGKTGFFFSGIDDFHSFQSRNRKYCRNCHCDCSRRSRSSFLDVAYGSHWRSIRFY